MWFVNIFAEKNLACGTSFPWKNHKKFFVCGSSYSRSSAGLWPKPLKRSASIDIIWDVVARRAWRGRGAEDKQGDTGEVRTNTSMERTLQHEAEPRRRDLSRGRLPWPTFEIVCYSMIRKHRLDLQPLSANVTVYTKFNEPLSTNLHFASF